jgi:hypothetical protein
MVDVLTKEKRTQRRKPRRIVEYRWFPATPDTGLLGGIVASDRATAEVWATTDLGANRSKKTLVRVRLEYTL